MTLKEQKLLAELEKEIINALLVANPDSITKEICHNHIEQYDKLSGEGKINLMMGQFRNLVVYLKYQCLDVESLRRESAILVDIINHYEDMLKGN